MDPTVPGATQNIIIAPKDGAGTISSSASNARFVPWNLTAISSKIFGGL